MLHLAVGCSSKMVEKFLGLGAGIEAADRQGRTALHYSAAKGKTRPLCCCVRYCETTLSALGKPACRILHVRGRTQVEMVRKAWDNILQQVGQWQVRCK